ncbi:DUF4330 family protein [Aneurinibacillus terranovensis]|uniref:DUF4330 family protein n=1 Tax=Aneurinibacillus terranovensis TaxID=278991 RepID=UPI0003FA8D93|nr:DUF4330 family protein [Aneurinibacillus terranovensis]
MDTRPFSFTLRDVLITILILISLCIIGFKVNTANHLKMPARNMTVSLVIEGQPLGYHTSIQPGDRIFQKGSLAPFGTVVSVDAKPTQVTIPMDNGQLSKISFTGEEDVYVKIKSSGFVSLHGSPIIDDTFFYVNQYLPAKTNRAVFGSRIVDVEIGR